MTRENIIKQLKRLIPSLQYADDVNAVKGAIKALSQEPTTPMSTFDIAKQFGIKLEPCDDVVSRILARMWNCRGKHTTSIDKVKMEQIIRDELPPVTRQTNCEYDKSGYCYSDDSCNYQFGDSAEFCGIHKEKEMPCSDVISRDWLKTTIHNFYYGLKHIPSEEDIQAYIDAAPSVTQKSGK